MISLGDLLSGDTMAGEAGQQAPKILLGAADIANAFLNQESAQNKLMMEDLKLRQELENAPVEALLKKAKGVQELNIADPTPGSEDMMSAAKELYPEGVPVNENGELALPEQDLKNVQLVAKKKAEERLKLAPYDVMNPVNFLTTRADAGLFRPDYEVKKEIADLAAEARAIENDKKFKREFEKLMAAQGFTLKTIGMQLEAQERRQNKALRASEEKQNKALANQRAMLEDRQAQQDKRDNEARAQDFIKKMGEAANNSVLTKEKRSKIIAESFKQVQKFGSPAQIEAAYEAYSKKFPGIGSVEWTKERTAKANNSGFQPPKRALTDKEKAIVGWAQKNMNNPKAKAALEKLRAQGKL